jgi:hypothetical protein
MSAKAPKNKKTGIFRAVFFILGENIFGNIFGRLAFDIPRIIKYNKDS